MFIFKGIEKGVLKIRNSLIFTCAHKYFCVYKLFQGCFKEASRVSLRVFQGSFLSYFKKVQRVLPGRFLVVSRLF